MFDSLSKAVRPALVAIIAVPMLFTTQGCSDDEVAAGLGAVAIVAGVGAIASAVNDDYDDYDRPTRPNPRHPSYPDYRPYPNPHYPRTPHYPGYPDYRPTRPNPRHHGSGHAPSCRGGYREYCTHYNDQWGNVRRECRNVYENCQSRWSTALDVEGLSEVTLSARKNAVDRDTAIVASKYGISFEGASRLTGAFHAARKGDLAPVKALGLSEGDLKAVASLRMVSEASLQALASNLQVSAETAKSFVEKLIADVKAQAADIKSDYWQACTAGKKWKTPQNLRCEQTFWPGCSPQSGATLCVAM